MGTLTLGSMFDGSGGFPLGGILAGIKPVWASEIEPFPIRVTTKRLPFMKHYGDVNRLDGRELEPVDIITFGSPCTDLSIAGKRAGLEGSQSGLFHQAIRVIKEMREKTNGIYPRFIVWENVPGAFSSHGGDDFQKVLEKICGICDGSVSVPGSAKWEPAGCILGDGFSVAWRVLDAPSAENASILSDILLVTVPEKYYLSRKACLGILQRASARGKELPAILKAALERQASVSA